MNIEIAALSDIAEIMKYDRHIPQEKLEKCISDGQVYLLRSDSAVGVLRFSFFWQTIPFLDLIFLDEPYRNKGFGSEMMRKWESDMEKLGYEYVMTSTQADEDAWRFYEKIGYHRVGGFFPPEQEAEEIIYLKKLK